ncbi:unnamed protein product [Durusdinium trenchii]|uniref:Uncharacterized protein n=1 Tax=Durusdinium trenchii TaxID=1381693 RepID=A0ABP0SYD2_9DINO
MQNTLAGFNQGIRRMDRECIVAWCCYPAAGVISSSKQHFLLQQVTSLCHSNPKSLVAVVVMPNRVRTATVCFEPSSIYGNRTGYHSLLLITANDKTNQFHRTAFWRSGLTTGRKFAAGAVCHSGQSASFCGNLIAQKVFGMCRTEHLSLPGFPNFAEALRSLKAMDKVSCPNYEVCIALGNGTLVIKEALVELWSKKHAEFAAETEELLKNHNAEFNRENIKRGLEKSNESETKNEPIKKLCLEGTLEIDEFEKQHSDRLSLPCGTFTLHWCKEKALLYITAEKDCTAAANTELFGMGSGDFLQSTEAEDVMSDTSSGGRWLHFNLSGGGRFTCHPR